MAVAPSVLSLFHSTAAAIMAPEPVNQWSVDDVATWLCAIGLGSKVEAFKENAVDGGLLCTLSKEDLQNDLELSGIQAKKVLMELDFANSLTSGGGGGADPAEIEALQAQLKEKDAKIAQLEQEIAALKPAPPPEPVKSVPAPAPAPTYHAPAPAPRRGRPVVKGAAGGAAKGAATGAVGES